MATSTKQSNYFWNFSERSLDLFANSFFLIARRLRFPLERGC